MHHEYVFRTGQQCPRCNRELVKSRTENVFVWCEDVYCGYGKVKMEREGQPGDFNLSEIADTATCKLERMERDDFVKNFNATAAQCHNTALEKGWWDKEHEKERTFASFIANCQAELSEAWEYYRKAPSGTTAQLSDHIPEFYGIEEELADVIIRIMDMACKYEIRVAEALIAKMAYNRTRPHRHGGKRA